jgi:hypothetical protein
MKLIGIVAETEGGFKFNVWLYGDHIHHVIQRFHSFGTHCKVIGAMGTRRCIEA